MELIKIKLKDIKEPDRNVRMHTEQQIREFERSVNMFGQIRPIVVDEDNVIMAGCGLYKTLVKMGKEEADCYKLSNLTENQKKKLMIADNKIFNLGVEDLQTLTSFLEEMGGDLDVPGYDEEILQQMMADSEDITEKVSSYGTLDDTVISDIKEKGSHFEEKAAEAEKNEAGKAETVTSADDSEPTDIKKFVICPKCGEKIWL